jgi:hypothetical protein
MTRLFSQIMAYDVFFLLALSFFLSVFTANQQMDIPLIVIPNPGTWPWIDCLDRKQVLHLPRFEDASLGIDERDALVVKDESWL